MSEEESELRSSQAFESRLATPGLLDVTVVPVTVEPARGWALTREPNSCIGQPYWESVLVPIRKRRSHTGSG